MMFFVPEAYQHKHAFSSRTYGLSTLMNFPHVVMNLCEETSKTLRVPYCGLHYNFASGEQENMNGQVKIIVWNPLKTGPSGVSKLSGRLYITPRNVRMAMPRTQLKFQSVNQEEPVLGSSNQVSYMTGEADTSVYAQIQIPDYVDTETPVEARYYPEFGGARHWLLRSMYAYMSGSNEIQFTANSQKNARIKIAVSALNHSDPTYPTDDGIAAVRITPFEQPQTAGKPKALPNPRTQFWFPQETNTLRVSTPHLDIFPLKPTSADGDTLLYNRTSAVNPTWIRFLPFTDSALRISRVPSITAHHMCGGR